MNIALALVAAAPTAAAPVTVSPAPPLACQAAEYAMRDQMAVMAMHVFPERKPGPLGKEYLEVSDRLAVAMRSAKPDLEKIDRLMQELNVLKLEIAKRVLVNTSNCQVARLRAMPLDEQRSALRTMSPPTRDERERVRVAPVPPPQIRSEAPK